jgi:hypothetical protein
MPKLDVRRAMRAQRSSFRVRRVGEYLSKLERTPWFSALGVRDRLRAVKTIAYAASQLEGATAEQSAIIGNTLDGLVSGRIELAFESLPFGARRSINGHRRAPRTVVLNRRALPADERPVSGRREEHVALATLVHEVNHLCNGVPEGPTYAAFQDEYRAWYVAFIALFAREPRKVEALARCKELLVDPAYGDIQRAVRERSAEGARIFGFLRTFGSATTREELLALELDDLTSPAPPPDPALDLSNAGARRHERPRPLSQ